jgi:hypothetical protein
MSESTKQPRVKTRSLVSILSFLFFLALVFSGLILIAQPHGRVAYWTSWHMLGLDKDQWDGVHVIAGLAMIVVGILHVILNIRPLLKHLGKSAVAVFRPSRELAVALVVFLVLVVSAAASLPPVSYVLDFNDWLKASWIRTPGDAPPFAHAEMHPLKSLCQKEGLDLERALADLTAAGFSVDATRPLGDLATANDTSPAALYGLVLKGQGRTPTFKKPGQGPGRGGPGGGPGRGPGSGGPGSGAGS